MNTLKQIRQQYRINQTGLAAILNVSRSLINMVEMGERDLPAEAIKKLVQLQRNDKAALAISRQPIAKASITKISNAQNNTLQKILTTRLGKLQHQLYVLQQKLGKAESLHHKAMDTLLNVSAQRTARSLVPAEHIQQVWLNDMEASAKLELYRMPKYQLELLRIKVETLAAEIRIVEGRLIA